jgi:hypothetical protein
MSTANSITTNNSLISEQTAVTSITTSPPLLKLLLHFGSREFSMFFRHQLSELLSVPKIVALLATCREIYAHNVVWFTAPVEWTNAHDVRGILSSMLSSIDLQRKIVVSNVRTMVVGANNYDAGLAEFVTDEWLELVGSMCPQLTSLGLGNCIHVTDTGLSALPSTLISLHLRSTQIKGDGLIQLAQNGMQLLHLTLADCSNINDVSMLNISRNCTELKFLDLSGWPNKQITDIGVTAVGQNCRKLTHLFLAECICVTDLSVACIAMCCTQLLELHIAGCFEITDSSLMAIAHHCTQLLVLDIEDCENVTGESVSTVANLCTNLTQLNLQGCNVVVYPNYNHLM